MNGCDKHPAREEVPPPVKFQLMSTRWVHERAAQACTDLPNHVDVVMGNIQRFGELPVMEWGKVTMN